MIRSAPAATLTLTITLLACGSAHPGPSPHPIATSTSSSSGAGGSPGTGGAGGSTGTGGAGGTGTGGAGGSATGGGGTGGELGSLPVDSVPDTACVAKGGTSAEVYPKANAPTLDRLQTVGVRWAAGGSQAGGLYTFDADGSAASAQPIKAGLNYNVFASEGDTVGLVASDSTVVYRRYDAAGQAAGQPLTVDGKIPDSVAIAGGAGEALVVWAQGGGVHARGIDTNGSLAGAAFGLGAGVYGSTIALAAASAPSGFAVAWSGDAADVPWRTSIAFATTTGAMGAPVEVVSSDVTHRVVKLVATPGGFAMLLTGGPPKFAPYVLVLGAQGQVVGSAHKLVGAYFGWDLAALGNELGLVAVRSTLEPEFRPFDAAMAPLGSWVCLDAPTDIGDVGAVSADGPGYAVLYRTPAGAEQLVRFDHLGTGP